MAYFSKSEAAEEEMYMDGNRKIRVAMIGAGSMANSVHYPSLHSFADVEMVGVCDLDDGRRETTADRYGIAGRYTNYRKMVEETDPDAVYAVGQPEQMYNLWVWCLQQKRNLYVEKPLGLTIHEAKSLANLAEKNGCITQVSFQRRSCPLLTSLYEKCVQQGPITHAVCEFYKCNPDPVVAPTDHMMGDSVHAIDTLRWLCGGEVRKIHSINRRVGVPDLNFFAVLLEFDNGATGVLLNSWTSGRRIFRVEMHAPNICAEADPEGKGAIYKDGDTTGEWYDTREVSGGDQTFIFGGFQAKNREFIDALKGGRRPSSHFEDAVKTMEVAEKILAQGLLRGD